MPWFVSLWSKIEVLFAGEPALWLWIEGIAPLFGAGVLFLLWGVASWVTKQKGAAFSYAWQECVDSMGWLYGTIILAVQAGVRSTQTHEPPSLTVASFGFALVSLVFLFKSMNARGSNPAWRPQIRLHVAAVLLAVATLAVGFQVQALSEPEGVRPCSQTQPSNSR